MAKLTTRILLACAAGAAAVAAPLVWAATRDEEPLPPEKAALEARIAQDRAEGLARARPKPADPSVERPAPERDPAPPTGVIEEISPPVPASRYLLENGWQDLLGSDLVSVYAGASTDDPAQGVVLVLTMAWEHARNAPVADTGQLALTAYPTPSREGSVRVTGARGPLLLLQAASGARFTFNVASRTYVSG